MQVYRRPGRIGGHGQRRPLHGQRRVSLEVVKGAGRNGQAGGHRGRLGRRRRAAAGASAAGADQRRPLRVRYRDADGRRGQAAAAGRSGKDGRAGKVDRQAAVARYRGARQVVPRRIDGLAEQDSQQAACKVKVRRVPARVDHYGPRRVQDYVQVRILRSCKVVVRDVLHRLGRDRHGQASVGLQCGLCKIGLHRAQLDAQPCRRVGRDERAVERVPVRAVRAGYRNAGQAVGCEPYGLVELQYEHVPAQVQVGRDGHGRRRGVVACPDAVPPEAGKRVTGQVGKRPVRHVDDQLRAAGEQGRRRRRLRIRQRHPYAVPVALLPGPKLRRVRGGGGAGKLYGRVVAAAGCGPQDDPGRIDAGHVHVLVKVELEARRRGAGVEQRRRKPVKVRRVGIGGRLDGQLGRLDAVLRQVGECAGCDAQGDLGHGAAAAAAAAAGRPKQPLLVPREQYGHRRRRADGRLQVGRRERDRHGGGAGRGQRQARQVGRQDVDGLVERNVQRAAAQVQRRRDVRIQRGRGSVGDDRDGPGGGRGGRVSGQVAKGARRHVEAHCMGRCQRRSCAACEQPRLLVRSKLERCRRRLDRQPSRLAAAFAAAAAGRR